MSIIFALLGLSIIILVHELGHFLVAKSAGVSVEEFSIGMGKSLFQKKLKETIFSIRILPIGGYVRINALEKAPDETSLKDSCKTKIPFWDKFKILFSGSLFNFIFAWLVFLIIVFFSGIPEGVSSKVNYVFDDSPAKIAGIREGDTILSVNGQKVSNGEALVKELSELEKLKKIVVNRNNQEYVFDIIPKTEDGKSMIGVRLELEKSNKFSLFKSFRYSLEKSINVLLMTYKGFGMLITGKIGIEQISGPVGIIRLTDQASTQGIAYFFSFLAVLSINLSVINLFPFPALDGGRILMLFFDKIFGEKVSKNFEAKWHLLGFIILILFVIYISYFDIQKILLK